MSGRWRFPRLANEPISVGGETLAIDAGGFVVGPVSPAVHAVLAGTRFQGFKAWEWHPAPAPTLPPPNTPALDAETLAPDLISEPAPVAPTSDNTRRKRGKT